MSKLRVDAFALSIDGYGAPIRGAWPDEVWKG